MMRLFGKARRGLEQVARAHVRDAVYLRSLYLFGEETLAEVYPGGYLEHHWRVFDHGPAEAFLFAGRSFAQSGFCEQALRALAHTEEAARQPLPSYTRGCTEADLRLLAEEARALSEVVSGASPVELVAMQLAPTHVRAPLVSSSEAQGQ